MTATEMASLQRVLTTLGHREPDRVPLFLFVTMHGARELGLSIKEYYARPEHVVEGQLRMLAKYGHDCAYTVCSAAVEVEALGGEVVFRDDGPPTAGAPIIRRPEDILRLELPDVKQTPCLAKVLEITRQLKERLRERAPVIGAVVSPFSLPIMQMGFDKYLDLIYERPDLLERLVAFNAEFCVAWANAQLEAGATAVGYFDPMSSPTVTPPALARHTGLPIARRTIARIRGVVGFFLGSGRCLGIVDDVAATGATLLGASTLEDLAAVKAACRGRMTVVGNLNGVEMRRWTPAQAEGAVKEAIAKAGPGGGFILADNHGEIPWQVPESVLLAIAEAARRWGPYPLQWVAEYEG